MVRQTSLRRVNFFGFLIVIVVLAGSLGGFWICEVYQFNRADNKESEEESPALSRERLPSEVEKSINPVNSEKVVTERVAGKAPVQRRMGGYIARGVIAFTISIGMAILLSNRLAAKLAKELRAFSLFIRDAASEHTSITDQSLRIREFRELAVATNEMIEDRLRAEEHLRKAEEKYRSIFEHAIEGIYQSTPEGRFLTANPAIARILGYESPDELMAAVTDIGAQLYVHPERREELLSLLERGPVSGFEVQFHRKDGGIPWVSLNTWPVYDEEGRIAYIEGMVQDITDRKLADSALAEEKERLAVTLRSIGDGVITTDVQGRIVLMNEVAEDLTGWKQKEARGRFLTEVFRLLHEKTRRPLENPVDLILRSGAITGLAKQTILISKDGAERAIADSGSPIRDRENKNIGVVLVFRDVAEKRKLEEELLRAEKLESTGILAGGIAHDFNNILTAILGNISLAKAHVEEEDAIYSRLDEAEKATLRATDLTQQLLTFSKGGAPIKKITSISDVIRDSAKFALRGSNVSCDFSLPDGLWSVEVDEGQISQVINNLIINAVQAIPEGGVIEVFAKNARVDSTHDMPLSPGRYIQISLRDYGVGIAHEDLPKIFDPYFTTKPQGNGLGLASSYSIVRRHAGQLAVESEIGLGTTFHIYLPASNNVVSEKRAPDLTQQAGKGKILVMDDEESIREVAGEILMFLGYDVVVAKDGSEAIDLYCEARDLARPFSAVIMDLTIPGGLGGKETIKHLLEIDPSVKVVVSSGYSNDPIMSHYAEHGFSAVMVKPYRIEEVGKILHTLLSA